jgi:hypothetical protein
VDELVESPFHQEYSPPEQLKRDSQDNLPLRPGSDRDDGKNENGPDLDGNPSLPALTREFNMNQKSAVLRLHLCFSRFL